MADNLSEIWDPYGGTNGKSFLDAPNEDVLTSSQKQRTKDYVYRQQISNLNYLYMHPEIHAIIRLIFKEIVSAQPNDIHEHLANFFATPKFKLRSLINENLKDIKPNAYLNQASATTRYKNQIMLPLIKTAKAYVDLKPLLMNPIITINKDNSVASIDSKANGLNGNYNQHTSISLFTDCWDNGASEIMNLTTYT